MEPSNFTSGIGYIYLDIEDLFVAWECYRGALLSPYKPETDHHSYISVMFARAIQQANNIKILNEFIFEMVRQAEFQHQVSRLRCLYIFPDENMARNASTWGEHFSSENNLSKVTYTALQVTKVDANWISYAERDSAGVVQNIEQIRSYWKGLAYNNNPHWEYLVRGRARICERSLRQQSYENIKARLPNSLSLLELARIAERLEHTFGHACPYILRLSETENKLVYIMDTADIKKQEFWDKVKNLDEPVNYKDLKHFVETDILVFPDFREFERTFSFSGIKVDTYENLKIHVS